MLTENQLYAKKGMTEQGLRETFMKMDVELAKPEASEEIAAMKKENPPHKSPLMSILGETLDGMKNKDGSEKQPGAAGGNPLE
jgi:hypothetical protein